jgi:glycosyltransferase involved in cell wall biosynthesis
MRIGFDAQVLTEGKTAESHYLSRLVEHLLLEDASLEVFLFSPDKVCVDYEPYINSPRVTRVVERPGKARRNAWPARVLPRLLSRHGIDIFHAPIRSFLPFFRSPCPAVLTIFELPFFRGRRTPQSLWKELRGRTDQWLWSRSEAKIIALSDSVRAQAAREWRLPGGRIAVTPVGCDNDLKTAMSPREEQQILAKYHLEGRRYVLAVSGLDHSRRNPDLLLEAFARVHRQLEQDVYFVFTGNTFRSEGHYDRLLRKMSMLGIRDKVIAAGFVSDRVFQVIQANAAASVVTPFYSGVPMAILDAFVNGVPVVASDRGAIPEYAAEGAVLVDPYDVEGIARAVGLFLGNSPERDTYIEKGLLRARDFSWETMAKETLGIYADLVARSDR